MQKKKYIKIIILKVGIGGEHDCTNIVNNTVCAGITSLGLDHTSLLGDTIKSIAYQKSGIFKPGARAFTVSQTNEAMNVLKSRALEKNCILSQVPSLESYFWNNDLPILGIGTNIMLKKNLTFYNRIDFLIFNNFIIHAGIQSDVQKENASLAIQLASAWLSRNESNNKRSSVSEFIKKEIVNGQTNDEKKTKLCFKKVAKALESCNWPGRTQFLSGRRIDFYIDGAHTNESMECCVKWFKKMIKHNR